MQALEFWNCPFVENHHVIQLLENLKELRILNLAVNCNITSSVFTENLNSSTKLQDVYLGITDKISVDD